MIGTTVEITTLWWTFL